MKRVDRGFTLLEILAALAIIAVGMAAVTKTVGGAISVLQVVEERLVGSWVASNRLAELHIERAWPATNTRDHKVVLGGRNWFYREKVARTRDPDLLRVDISVYSDPDYERLASTLFGYVSRYSPPTIVPPDAGDSEDSEVGDESNVSDEGAEANEQIDESTEGIEDTEDSTAAPEQGSDEESDT